MGKLTDKQKAFCEEYLIDLNATQAAIRAGYSEKTATEIGCENLTKPNISAEIQRLMDERSKRVQIDADYVLGGLKEVTERCMQAEPVMFDGVPTGEYQFDSRGALKGYELLGKHLKLFSDKVDFQMLGKDGQPADPTIKLSPDEAYRALLDVEG